ncbi:uncharacterized protein LOC126559406 [Anopheles maculipalpis]|uniref:uncharacterized protein LOC126559406 n=1 Tax=Anopheles maculipalpis TaxID=1496333 RepID=UPI002159A336|nr:uncharacterized protein LOC126559406 [Anopheles maculipalpis]
MSSNSCKHGDREKDQNNNFVNSTAHGGAGIDREARARRIASRSARDDLQLFRGIRNQHHYQQQQPQQQQHVQQQSPTSGGGRAERDTTAGNGGGSQVTAKAMWGNVSAIKELREQEQNDRQLGTRATGRRQ